MNEEIKVPSILCAFSILYLNPQFKYLLLHEFVSFLRPKSVSYSPWSHTVSEIKHLINVFLNEYVTEHI
jgi:hypothetical protein